MFCVANLYILSIDRYLRDVNCMAWC